MDSDWAGALRSSYRCDFRRASQFVAAGLSPEVWRCWAGVHAFGFYDGFRIQVPSFIRLCGVVVVG